MLEIHNLNKRFGGLQAVSDFSLNLEESELKGLIGPNGAGKTTIFNLISGMLRPDRGQVLFNGTDITKYSPDRRVELGIARTFQKIRIQKYVTVLEKVKIAFFTSISYNFLDTFLLTRKYRDEEKRIEQEAYDILNFLGIENIANELTEELSHGLQMKVSIARALAMKPKILLLDEPASGLNQVETKNIVDLISSMIKKFGLSILLIEHDMSVIMSICHNIVAVNEGKIIGSGTPKEIQNNGAVLDAYLGGI